MSVILTPNQLKAIALLMQGYTGKEAAESCGVTPQTISEWRQNPAFDKELSAMKMEILKSARDNLQAASTVAVKTLVDLAENSTNSEVRRKAALNILELDGFSLETVEMFAWGIT